MSENNAIINSLKRLERVGSENSRVTYKLKQACEKVALELKKIIIESGILPDFQTLQSIEESKIGNTRLYVIETSDDYYCRYDYDGQMYDYNFHEDRYKVINASMMSRDCALVFAKDIANGLINRIIEEIEKYKREVEKVQTEIESKTK